jgi:DeoR family transcriptional regulator of aga operon
MDALPADVRRARLQAMVSEAGFVGVPEAALRLGVTEVTIRSDLGALEGTGVLRRVRGGAVARQVREAPVEASLLRDASLKRAMGARAAAQVRSGTAVFLDVGSTALAVATALVERADLADVVIVTNGLSTALALEPAIPRMTVVLTGGTLRPL